MAKWMQSFVVPSTSGRGSYTGASHKTARMVAAARTGASDAPSVSTFASVKAQARDATLQENRAFPTCHPANVTEVQS